MIRSNNAPPPGRQWASSPPNLQTKNSNSIPHNAMPSPINPQDRNPRNAKSGNSSNAMNINPATPQHIQNSVQQSAPNSVSTNIPVDYTQQPQINSSVPPLLAGPKHPFGKLSIKLIRGINLKAGQGFFGKADPYVKLKLGEKEWKTDPHSEGGKNPVSNFLTFYRAFPLL